ncbi:hypothetical protein OEZ85_007544 [Tetradesmus obliquus]|uniref:Structural maintenance of chromosomes protein n=1 Tax=Tetradesmus obliquus TaxID=3088 RepID=A0ABY8TG82_TETOB|nr:hypothetical protein OEZ85_007544 [Tetradesmus obliquus]
MEVEHPKKRLMIREMVLENFKSYAGAQHVGPFHKCFSSVVGPNGSGKSNVIDAMLFVFGRRAKQLRFNKVAELIHNSTNHRNLERACVTVHFQEIIDLEGDDYEVIPGSEFTVARTANRNNTSDYYVSGKRMNVKEVTSLLKAKGIDLDNNRFLILQGEVEQISLMKPKAEEKGDTGLLEYLEDIIGTDRLIPQIEEEAKKLEEMNERRGAMVGKLKGVEKELSGLEGKKVEAEAYISKQAERLRCSILGNSINKHSDEAKLADSEAKATKFTERLAHERSKRGTFDKELKAVEAEHSAAEKALEAASRKAEAAATAMKELEQRDVKIRMDLKHLKTKRQKAQQKHKNESEQLATLEADVARWQAEIPADQAAAEQLGQQLEEAEAKLEALQDSIKGEVEAHHQAMSKVRAELAPWESQMAEVQSAIDVATSERDLLLKQQQEAKDRLAGAQEALAAAKRVAAEKEAEIQQISSDMEAQRGAAEQAKQQLEVCSQQEQQLEGQLRRLRTTCAGLKADSSSAASQSAVVKALLAARASGDIPGVYGRLGDLGAIDAKYDVAISTACTALDYIVVESTSDAQRCVELLRRQHLGVATCLILEKQKHLAAAMNERVSTPEGVPRLFDLVSVSDPKLRLAFWYALRHTLVADNLDQASRIAYGTRDKRFSRVVTMAGQLIAESGTMSGGGGKLRGGRMKLGNAAPRAAAADGKAAAKELAATEAQLAEVEGQLRQTRNERDAAEKALAAAQRALAQLELAAPKAAQVAKAKREEAADLQARLAELKAAAEAAAEVRSEHAARLTELSSQLAASTAQLAKLRASCAGLQKKVAGLQDKIDNAGGEPLRKQKERVASLQSKQQEASGAATKKAVQLKAAGKQLDKLKKDLSKSSAEQEKLAGEVEAAMQSLNALTEEAGAVVAQQEEAGEAAQQLAAALQEVRERRDKKQEEVSVIASVEVELEAAIEKCRGAEKDLAKSLRELAKAIAAEQVELKKYQPDAEEYVVAVEQLEGGSAQEAFFRVTVLEEELRVMAPDLGAIQAYRDKEADFAARQAEYAQVTAERDEVRGRYDALRKSRLDGFMAGFNAISLKLKEMYQMITLGGDAELELVDTLDPFSEGIVFSVRPPKKSWKHIANLSGGEKTLSSLSLVFALHHYKPTPLYVMDEIDAALDFKNVSIVGHYIKERTKNAQFVIISLRNNMFELADRLVGIYKTDNATKTVTINPHQFVVGGAAAGAAGKARGAAAAAAAAAGDAQEQQDQQQQGLQQQQLAVPVI